MTDSPNSSTLEPCQFGEAVHLVLHVFQNQFPLLYVFVVYCPVIIYKLSVCLLFYCSASLSEHKKCLFVF